MSEPIDSPKIPEFQEPIPVTPVDAQVDTTEKIRVEEFQIDGDTVVTKIKELIHQGNIRRITLKNEAGHTLIEIPMTVGIVGGAIAVTLAPILAAIGAIGALVARLTITIERVN
ncbi:MAG: DUF4342 domain-containing protein [Geitlerinemataceae cyanobacterium]